MFNAIGCSLINTFTIIGEYFLFASLTIKGAFSKELRLKRVIEQMFKVGAQSFIITAVTLTFVGMVFSSQVTKEFLRMGAAKIIGGIVGIAIWRELGPLLTAVVVAARVGAAISSEIAAMKVTEQIDALRSMALNPFSYLYAPRVIALVFMLPLLIVMADFMGFFAGMFIYVFAYHGNSVAYLVSAAHMLNLADILVGVLIKGPIFGFVIALTSTFVGSRTTSGSQGIGISTTLAVVASLIILFVVNFFISFLVF
ncbi:MAG: ABC transporter permease [Candidatus Margulisbacteria bacterium]|nr:ABC transporter permease [Candidatus Margulisiibacteriota bacterium]